MTLAFGFLPKKELQGFSLSTKEGTYGLFGFRKWRNMAAFLFLPKKELWAYWFLLQKELEGFQISAKKENFGLSCCSHRGRGGFSDFPSNMTFWLSGFCQWRDFRASRFLPKKELMGFSVSSKAGAYGLSGFCQRKNTRAFRFQTKEGTCGLSDCYQRGLCGFPIFCQRWLIGFRVSAKEGTLGNFVSSTEGTYGLSGFCQRKNMRELSGFKQKKELVGFLISAEEGDLVAFRFLAKKELLGFPIPICRSARGDTAMFTCSTAWIKRIHVAFSSILMGQFHEICFLPFTSVITNHNVRRAQAILHGLKKTHIWIFQFQLNVTISRDLLPSI